MNPRLFSIIQELLVTNLPLKGQLAVFLSISNGFASKDRLDGIHVEIADWQTDMKFLCVSKMLIEHIVLNFWVSHDIINFSWGQLNKLRYVSSD